MEEKRMNKAEFIDAVAAKEGMNKKDAAKAVNGVFDCISEALAAGDKVQVIGFGTFEVRAHAAKQGRNPKTGAAITIPASKSPAFKAGKALKDSLQK
jgi:DNA-binding protein HU-beta